MAHWAWLDENNKVINVTVGSNNEPDEGYQWLVNNIGGKFIKTSYNTKEGIHYQEDGVTPSEDQSKALRKNYAGIDYTYDEIRDAFIPPKPFEKWILNEETCQWEPPIPYPTDGLLYVWNDNKGEWEEKYDPTSN